MNRTHCLFLKPKIVVMYKSILKPIFFLFNPETAHKIVVTTIKTTWKIPFVKQIARKMCRVEDPRLEKKLFGLHFPNPVGMAAGFDKEGKLYNELSDLGFGFVEIGTFTPKGQSGNPKPRLFRIPKDEGLINRMGFNNSGVEEAVKRLKKNKPRCIIGGNIGKNTATPNEKALDDYKMAFDTLFPYVDYFVVNVSCPNVTDLCELQDKDSLNDILKAVTTLNQSKSNPKPILLKISPDLNFNQIEDTLSIVKANNVDGIIATNTSVSRANLKTDSTEIQKIANGGLSGKPIKKRSTEIIRFISDKTNGSLPIIGVGGIFSAEDAIEKLDTGADLVQIYSGYIYEGPMLVKRINKALLQKEENRK